MQWTKDRATAKTSAMSSEGTPRSLSDDGLFCGAHVAVSVTYAAPHTGDGGGPIGLYAAVIHRLTDEAALRSPTPTPLNVGIVPDSTTFPHAGATKHRRRRSVSLSKRAFSPPPLLLPASETAQTHPVGAVMLLVGWLEATVRPPVTLWTAGPPWRLARLLLDAVPHFADADRAPPLLLNATLVQTPPLVPRFFSKSAECDADTDNDGLADAGSARQCVDAIAEHATLQPGSRAMSPLARSASSMASSPDEPSGLMPLAPGRSLAEQMATIQRARDTWALQSPRSTLAWLAAEVGVDLDVSQIDAEPKLVALLSAQAARRGRTTVYDTLRNVLFNGRPDPRLDALADAVVLFANEHKK